MSWGKPKQPLVMSSSAPALSTRRNQPKLAPIAAASEKALSGLRRKKVVPSPHRARDEAYARRKLDALGTYVIETGCYEMVDAMLQAVLVEKPTAALPYLVTFARLRERTVLAGKLEQGKVLSPEEMDLLRGGHAPLDPDSADLLKPVDLMEPKLNSDHARSEGELAVPHRHTECPSGGAWQRRAWESYLGHQQVDKMLQSLMQEILQKQPASPLAFTTRWLEATLEKQLAEARVRVAAEKAAQAEREAAEAEARAALQMQVTSEVKLSESEVLSPGIHLTGEGRRRTADPAVPLIQVRLDVNEERGEALAVVVIAGAE